MLDLQFVIFRTVIKFLNIFINYQFDYDRVELIVLTKFLISYEE